MDDTEGVLQTIYKDGYIHNQGLWKRKDAFQYARGIEEGGFAYPKKCNVLTVIWTAEPTILFRNPYHA